ncbi:hypothetical protein ONZ60_19230 [Aeromonas salmonicida]|uniref:hypothetical protein n=1 Tax=Aeromonas salmonicida TaxID=645 RepID=UPI001F5B0649|nr:hypothetical protein [Aeromonas salmonicida]WCH30970.1 hypothetical protein ONZ67_19075 [Aeromonas salmonicida]WCH35169.1 hypothetical protein ONZ60_19230 [Aeromonas salmonicida]
MNRIFWLLALLPLLALAGGVDRAREAWVIQGRAGQGSLMPRRKDWMPSIDKPATARCWTI